jgi:hypothetical protein
MKAVVQVKAGISFDGGKVMGTLVDSESTLEAPFVLTMCTCEWQHMQASKGLIDGSIRLPSLTAGE